MIKSSELNLHHCPTKLPFSAVGPGVTSGNNLSPQITFWGFWVQPGCSLFQFGGLFFDWHGAPFGCKHACSYKLMVRFRGRWHGWPAGKALCRITNKKSVNRVLERAGLGPWLSLVERDQDRFPLHTAQRGGGTALSFALNISGAPGTEYAGDARIGTEVRICITVRRSRKRQPPCFSGKHTVRSVGVNRALEGKVWVASRFYHSLWSAAAAQGGIEIGL